MGTETIFSPAQAMDPKKSLVKLNNPLMGTETIEVFEIEILHGLPLVKLNNPLMGTETTLPIGII